MNTLKEKLFRVLKWSEKYTKTDMVYVGTNGFWLSLNQFINLFTALILSIAFANFIPKEIFGTYRYILSMIGLITAFSLTGINTAVVRSVAQGFDRVFKQAIQSQIMWSIPRVIFGLGISIYYFGNSNTVYGFAFFLAAFLAPIASIVNTFGPYLEGKKLFKVNSIYGIYSNLFHISAMLVACFFYPSVIVLVSFYYLSSSIVQIFFFYKTYKTYPPVSKVERDEDIQYAKELSVMNVLGGIASQVDNLVVYHLLGPVNLAVYTFATLIPEKIKSSFGMISTVALPKFAENEKKTSLSILRKFTVLTLFSFGIIILYSVVAPYVFKIFFPEYTDSIFYSQIYALSLLVIPAYITLPKLLANNKKKELFILSTLVPVFKILVTYFAIVTFGILGAIVARIASYVLHIALSLFFVLEKDS